MIPGLLNCWLDVWLCPWLVCWLACYLGEWLFWRMAERLSDLTELAISVFVVLLLVYFFLSWWLTDRLAVKRGVYMDRWLSGYLSVIYWSVCHVVSLSFLLFICLAGRLSICLVVCIYLSVGLFVCLPIYLCVYPSIRSTDWLTDWLSNCRLSVHLPVDTSFWAD